MAPICVLFSSLGQTNILIPGQITDDDDSFSWTLWKEIKTALHHTLQRNSYSECFSISLSLQVPLLRVAPHISSPAHHFLHSHPSCLWCPCSQCSPKHAGFYWEPSNQGAFGQMSTTCWLFRGESGPLCTMYFDIHQWERMTLSLIIIFQVRREKRKRIWQIQVVGHPCTDSLTLPSDLFGHHWLSNTYLRVLGWRSVPVPGWPWWHLDPFNMSFRSLSPRKAFLPLSISKSLSLWYALNENNRHCKTPVSSLKCCEHL